MDLRLGNNFELVFNNDLSLVDGIDEQKQRFLIFLKTLRGSLSYAPHWGLDYLLLLKLLKINNLDAVKNYFHEISKELNLDLINISTTIQDNKAHISFFFSGDVLNMEFNL
ncbi:DUF2634 domain-containing protein [Borreliella burgdorferi]|uniref:DUF2634 domain-containing protein n=3 Tax=Borreliella burgdorferi TaxID=139 RepID=A0A9N7G3T2_BORBG|nr:DUF2634 domain-containing protein [Borreliella burgdorferi]ACM10488.1 conserved hypothetical protein [Borreliella burgdorferi 72a]ACN23862.1 conserved hypothetical protein [Borreliella burgdorferi 64b]ACN55138.1 conserved hypothetical protein [Borreliella burgdorferi WI91-23]ACN55351.1 conserved hypothetical protein [Borreliella burgdorferi WI91-23]ACN56018.1 conserved hypothetical protein [Borreliella burgdorferi CA-11.2A]